MNDSPSIDFEAETRPEGGDGRYSKKVPYGWEGGPGVPYGGWTVGVAIRAAGMESDKERPASLTAQFLRPLALGTPLELDVEVLRRGRRSDTVRIAVQQEGRLGVHALVVTTDAVPGLEFDPEGTPSPPDPDGLPTLGEVIRRQGGQLPDGHHIDHYEYRVPDDRSGEVARDSMGREALVGWIRYGPDVTFDDPYLEAARFCVPADTQVPAAFLRAGLLSNPDSPIRGTTLDLLVHFHRTEQATPWLWYETHVQTAHAGLASGTCNLWSEDGRLLATSMSQVAFLPRQPT